jgi:PAS domain S-box-containing protein
MAEVRHRNRAGLGRRSPRCPAASYGNGEAVVSLAEPGRLPNGLPPKRISAGGDTRAPALQSVLSIAELRGRPSRPPDHAAENHALIALAEQLAMSPAGILQALTETALRLCGAHSAGISLLEPDGNRFHWPAIAGKWAEHVGGGTPREYGPCGTVLDRDTALLFSHPERDFDYFAPVTPLVEEALLMPFYLDGKAVGTIWVIAHDTSRRFDTEDLRLMTNLGTFAASAYQTILSLTAMRATASVVDNSDDAIITKDLNGTITSWNRAAERIFGYGPEEVIGKPVNILIPTDQPNEEPAILERLRRGERIDHYETTRVRKDGSLIDISLTISPVKDPLGKIVGASKIARDITERKRAEAKISILGREAEHRTANVLATVQAMVHLTRAETIEDLKTAIEGRIQALAKVHRLFIQSNWAGADLKTIIVQELAPYCVGERARVEVAFRLLEPNTAQTIAVVVHELATNASKYGALSTPEGQINVKSLHVEDKLFVQWTETGGPDVSPPLRKGFGTSVMGTLIRQSHGEISFDWRSQGLACEIVIPQ